MKPDIRAVRPKISESVAVSPKLRLFVLLSTRAHRQLTTVTNATQGGLRARATLS